MITIKNTGPPLGRIEKFVTEFKGRFLLFQVHHDFANLFFKLSISTFYKDVSKFQQKEQS